MTTLAAPAAPLEAARSSGGAAPSTPGRLHDLEGYRGLAALGIVVFHAYQFCRGGTSGADNYAYSGSIPGHVLLNLDGLVSLFLILSGFLLYMPVSRQALEGRNQERPRMFILKRAVRILPLYWLAVLIVWTYRNPNLPGDWRDLLEHLTFTQVFDSRRIFYTIGPAWSLSVEIYFYLFLALLIVLLRRWDSAQSRHPMAVVLAAPVFLLIVSTGYKVWALFISQQPADRWSVWFNPVAKGDMFAVGMFLAVGYTYWQQRDSHPYWSSAVLVPIRLTAVVLLGLGCAIRTDGALTTAEYNLLSMIAFGMLMASSVFASPTTLWRRSLATRWLGWAGLISYSVYMWHEPVLLYLDQHHLLSHAASAFPAVATLLVVIAVPVGWLSYTVIEKPAAKLRSLFSINGRLRPYYGAAGEG